MRINTAVSPVKTHEGGVATRTDAYNELRRTVMTCMLWEDTFYESGTDIAQRISQLVKENDWDNVAQVAYDAANKMHLRHVPLFLVSELAAKAPGTIIADLLPHVITRADSIAEFLAIYWRDGKKPISAGIKKGLRRAFHKFSEYQFAKYNRDGAIKLRDVMFLVHPNPKDKEDIWDKESVDKTDLFKAIADNTLKTPDTWEVALSTGKNKNETFERLLVEGKLGGLATLRNLRNMLAAGVDENLIRTRLSNKMDRILPFQYMVAAHYAPQLEDALEGAMLGSLEGVEKIPGNTILLVDISGSMIAPLAGKGETTRLDVANGLAVLLRERCERAGVFTFSNDVVQIAPRRGFALRDAISSSQSHSSTKLREAITKLVQNNITQTADRIIVITDEQSSDGIAAPPVKGKSWVINVAPYENGVSYRNGWSHIDGWSDRVLDYIVEAEKVVH